MKITAFSGRRIAALLAAMLCVALVAPAAAQQASRQTPKPAAPPRPAPVATAAANPLLSGKIINRGAAETRALKIGKLDITVDVAGRTAKTVVTATFLNPTGNIIEGDFFLDMPAGSVVTGYALDVEDRMVEGVLVGKRRGTQAYEARVRAGVDPGLAEVTRTGAFRTRVFPIFPGKGRTVRLEFVSPVGPYGYVLPLRTDEPVGEASIRVTGDGRVVPGSVEGMTRGETRGTRLSGALRILPAAQTPAVAFARHHSGETFVEILDRVPRASLRAPDARRIRIYWDRSLSRRDDNLAREIELVRRYLQAVRPGAVDLITFASDRPGIATFEGAGLEDRVAAALKAVDYSGATSLDGLAGITAPPAGQCLAFSDGNINFSSAEAPRLGCVLYTVSSAPDADNAWLGAFARRSGGEHLDLEAMPVDQAVARLTGRSLRITGVSDGRRDLDYAVLPAGEDEFRIVAPAPGSGQLAVRLSGQEPRTYRVPATRPVNHDGLGALWARARLADMAAGPRPDEDVLQAFARRYSVADGSVVFIVLETAADYADAEIEPPASIGKTVMAEYRSILEDRAREKAAERKGRLDKIVNMWTDQVAWWEKAYIIPRERLTPDGRSQRDARRDREGGERSRESAAELRAPPPPPPPPAPPPPPVMAAPSADDVATEQVVVTGSRITRGADGPPAISIEVGEWNPDRPYLKALEAAPADRFRETLRAQAKEHGDTPAFWFDVAEWLHRKGRTAEALAVVVNAIEAPGADTTTLTLLADRLMRYGQYDRAIWVYEKILELEPDRPQPHRNLGLALIARAEHQTRICAVATSVPPGCGARAEDFQRGLDLLTKVIMTPWEGRYDGIELIALMEANRIVPVVRQQGGKVDLDPRLIKLLDTDLRIILEWNTDHTDMDLWVDEPSGERAIYSHPRTVIGGRLSNDMTQGYGPEEYLLRRAMDGEYVVSANVYANDRLNPNGSTTIRARIFRNWGRPDQEEQVLDLELRPDEKGTRVVGKISVGKPGPARPRRR